MGAEVWMLYTAGLGTLKAEMRDEDKRKVWNGSAFVLQSTLTDAQWRAGLLTLTEMVTADNTATGLYVGSVPGTVETAEYLFRAFASATPSPADMSVGEQVIAWRAQEITAEDLLLASDITNLATQTDIDNLEAHGDANWAGTGGGGTGTGSGAVTVNHDYGGTDALRYVKPNGMGIDDATIQAFLKTDFDANNRSLAYIVAETATDVYGRWSRDMKLDPAVYTLVCYKQGEFGPDTRTLTVTAE